MDLNGVAALVTGGASGLGEATVRRLKEAGAHCTIVDRNAERAEALAAELGGRTSFVAADVTSPEQVGAAIETAQSAGPLRVAVNCAGIGWAERTLNRDGNPHGLEAFSTVVQVNLVGTFNVLRLAAAAMAKGEPTEDGERGVIVNTASVAAFEGQIGQIAYTAAKAGIAGMCLTMARDLGSLGIRVLAIAPSLFLTGITSMVPDEMAAALTRDAAFPKRMGRPVEYAKLAAAIVDNPMLNGQCIRLDAGQRFAPK